MENIMNTIGGSILKYPNPKEEMQKSSDLERLKKSIKPLTQDGYYSMNIKSKRRENHNV